MAEETQRTSSELSFWTRLNPFHLRPPSVLKRTPQFEPDTRPQSSLEPSRGSDDTEPQGRYSTVSTPMPSESPSKPSRTPFILRTIAHRSSFSALKSRSKRKKDPKVRPPLPTLDFQQSLSHPGVNTLLDQAIPLDVLADEKENDWGPVKRRNTPSKRKLRKGSLKAVKSVPRDLKLSQNCTDNHVFSGLPALPSKTTSPIAKPIKTPTPRSKRSGSTPRRRPTTTPDLTPKTPTDADVTPTRPSGKGINRPSGPAPDISIDAAAFGTTPESMQIRRMRFEFNVELDNVTRRKRATSHSEIQSGSPKKILSKPLSPRHMSSPPSPLKYGSVTRTIPTHAPYRHPFTSQHPHPVPLSPVESITFADSTTFHHDFLPPPQEFLSVSTCNSRWSKSSPPRAQEWQYAMDDFEPLTQSGRTMDLEDGLDLLVRDEDLPTGTPGGRKADLRSGALIDGAPHERGAVRFFSRDMYGRPTPSPSPSPSPSPQQVKQGLPYGDSSMVCVEGVSRDFVGDDTSPQPRPITDSLRRRHNRRSSSPFEVKLTPIVTKRMSLDAFGAPEPPVTSSDSGHTENPIEESEEMLDEAEGEDEPDEEAQIVMPQVTHFRHTSLSTIRETPSSKASEDSSLLQPAQTPLAPRTPGSGLKTCQTGRTEYFTPLSPTNHSVGDVSVIEDSFVSSVPDRSMISPSVRREKYRSAPVLPIKRPSSTWTPLLDTSDAVERLRELETELRARETVLVQLKEELRVLKAKEQAREEEESWDKRVQRHHEMRELQERLEDKEEELEQMQQRAVEQVDGYKKALAEQQVAMAENEEFCETLQTAHDDLATRLAELEAQHSDLCNERHQDAVTLVALQDERDRLEASVDKHRRTDDLAQEAISELQMSIVKAEQALDTASADYASSRTALEDQISELQATLDSKNARVEEVEEMLRGGLEQEQELAKLRTRIHARDVQLLRVEHVLDDTREEADALRKESEERGIQIARLENRNNAKDSIIGVLRDKLGSAAYTTDELKAAHRLEISKMREEVDRFEGQAKALLGQVEGMDVAAIAARGEIEWLNSVLAEGDRRRDELVRGLESKVEPVNQALQTLQHEKEAVEATARAREVAWKEAVDALAKLEIERKAWFVEKEALERCVELSQDTQIQVDSLQLQLEEAHHDLAIAQDDTEAFNEQLDQLYSTSAAQQLMLTARDAEIGRLRTQLFEAEDSAASGFNASLRKSRDAERLVEELRTTIDELHAQLGEKDSTLQSAVLGVEMEKASGADVKSRLEAYLVEMDRLSMSEAGLRKQLEDARRGSADTDLKFETLNKRIAVLEEDKELLNVALDSKQTELVLLQRQGTARGLAVSTGRARPKSVAETPTRQCLASSTSSATSTSVLSRRPSSVISTNHKRDSWIPRTPTTCLPSTPTKQSPRKTQSTPTTARARKAAPLGVSTRHNKTPEKPIVKIEVKSGLTRQTSLPVLKGNKAGELGRSVSSRPPSVLE